MCLVENNPPANHFVGRDGRRHNSRSPLQLQPPAFRNAFGSEAAKYTGVSRAYVIRERLFETFYLHETGSSGRLARFWEVCKHGPALDDRRGDNRIGSNRVREGESDHDQTKAESLVVQCNREEQTTGSIVGACGIAGPCPCAAFSSFDSTRRRRFHLWRRVGSGDGFVRDCGAGARSGFAVESCDPGLQSRDVRHHGR